MKGTPVLTAREVMRALKRIGFVQVRSRGSHRRWIHADGRKATVPVHKGQTIPRGLLRKIVAEDLGMLMTEFVKHL